MTVDCAAPGGRTGGLPELRCGPRRPAPAHRERSATASTWCSLASLSRPPRASGWTFVASTTVSRPPSSRLPVMKCKTSKAALVAAWSFSSSLTRPRQKSEEITSVGRKCFEANVDLPDPDTPTNVTRQSSGILTVVIGRTPPSAWGVRPRRQRGRWGRTSPRSRVVSRRPWPTTRIPVRVHSKRWSRWRSVPAGSVSKRTLYSRLGVVMTMCAGRAWANTTRSKLSRRLLIEMLDHLDDGGDVEAFEAPIAVGERPLQQFDTFALAGRHGVEVQTPRRDLERPVGDVDVRPRDRSTAV